MTVKKGGFHFPKIGKDLKSSLRIKSPESESTKIDMDADGKAGMPCLRHCDFENASGVFRGARR